MEKGFTLIELVVALAITFLVVGVATAIFISIVDHQRRMLGEEEFINQASYAFEYVSRAMRTAVKDTGGGCVGQYSLGHEYYEATHPDAQGFFNGIKFLSADGVCHEVFFDSTDGAFKESKNGAPAQNLLSSQFTLKYARFIINGNQATTSSSDANTIQPRITMLLDILPSGTLNQREKILETTVSQRNLNAPL